MLRKLGALTAVGFLTLGTAASAESHTVLVLGDAFFPEISYVSDGDVITFVNLSGETQTVAGKDDQWTSTSLDHDEEYELTVWHGMNNEYFDNSDDTRGVISFAAAPLD